MFYLCFGALFMHVLKLTYWQDATVPVSIFCCFWFQKSYKGNILGIDKGSYFTKFCTRRLQKPDGDTWGRPGGPTPPPGAGTPWARLGGVWPTWWPPGSVLSPINCPRRKNPKSKPETSRKVPPLPSHRSQVSGDRSLCSGTLPGWGSAPGRISIDSTAISIAVADSYDEEWVVLPGALGSTVAMWFISLLWYDLYVIMSFVI